MSFGIPRRLLKPKRVLVLLILCLGAVAFLELAVHSPVGDFFTARSRRENVLLDPSNGEVLLRDDEQTDIPIGPTVRPDLVTRSMQGTFKRTLLLTTKNIRSPVVLKPDGKIQLSTDNSSTQSVDSGLIEANNASIQGMPEATARGLEPCPTEPLSLQGRLKAEVNVSTVVLASNLDETTRENPDVRLGGKWRPPNCTARHKVAIIIPFRDRKQHLQMLLNHLHPILQRQQLDYGVYVVEQYGNGTFNKATLMNIAYVFALSEDDYRCFIFHDVDLLSEDDRNLYTCADQPKHLSVAVSTLKYRLPYEDIFGGVVALTADQFKRVNGFSNMYWGWGSEDDDMSRRVRMSGWKIARPPALIARFRMIPHKKRRPSAAKDRVYDHIVSDFTVDGLNSLEYELSSVCKYHLFTHIVAKLKLQEPRRTNVTEDYNNTTKYDN